MKKFLYLIPAVLLLFFSCQKEEESKPILNVSPTAISGAAEAFESTVQIKTGDEWHITKPDDADWVLITPDHGTGNQEVVISIGGNPAAEQRSTGLTVTTSFGTKSIALVQAGDKSLSVSTTEIEHTFESFKDTIQIITVNDWTITNIPDWLTVSKDQGSGISDIVISGAENETSDQRLAELKIETKYASKSITVTQETNSLYSNPTTINLEGYYLDLSSGDRKDYMYIKGSQSFDFPAGESFSISLKVKNIPSLGSTQPRILYWSNGTAYLGLLVDRNSNEGKLGWFLVDKTGKTLRDGPLGSSGSSASNVTTSTVNDGEWHHIVLVYNASEQKSYIYLDGNKEGVVDSSPSFGGLSLTEDILVGDFTKSGANWNFGGHVDDLRFWGKALTKAEVYADAANSQSDAEGLIAGWNFENLNNNKFEDVTGRFVGILEGGASQGMDNPFDLMEHKMVYQDNQEYDYRCPALVTLPNGDLLLAADQRGGHAGDVGGNANISLVYRRSTNNGATWSDIKAIGGAPDGGVSDPAVVVDGKTGDIFVFGAYVGDQGDYLLYMYKSTDNGNTWTDPMDLTAEILNGKWPNGFKFIASGRGLYTQDGKIMFMLDHVSDGNYLVVSNDHGATWEFKDVTLSGADESKIAELNDGTLMVNARAGGTGARYIYTSTDEGNSWTRRLDNTLIDPYCNAGFISYTQKRNGFNKNRLLFSNNKSSSSRTNMTVRISYDGGDTWSSGQQISPEGGYSTLTVIEDGTIGLAYESSGSGIKFARFSLEYLTEGQDSLE